MNELEVSRRVMVESFNNYKSCQAPEALPGTGKLHSQRQAAWSAYVSAREKFLKLKAEMFAQDYTPLHLRINFFHDIYPNRYR